MNTEILKIDNICAQSEQIAHAGETLRNGGLVAIPTETVYGLAANALDGKAVKKIFEAKGRPQDNPLIVHIADISEVAPLVSVEDKRIYALAEKFWPGPLTVIMKKSALVPDETSGGLDTVAIRMPSDKIAAAVIKAAGVPLAAPSANTSGKPSPTNAGHVIEDMQGKIDIIIDGGSCEIGVESTVITLATGTPRLLRPGKVTPEELEEVLGDIELDPAVFSKLREGQQAHSPGMKYKHYSPDAQVFLLKGTARNAADYVNSRPTEGCTVLCFNGEKELYKCTAVEYGAPGNGLSQANRIFDELRKLDKNGVKTAFVRCPGSNGVELAVYNRLLRASAFRIIDADSHMPVIGLTGQTGAGKTTVCEHLKALGYRIIDGDVLARKAVENKNVLFDLANEFGKDILNPDGTLNRHALADKAFSSKEKTLRLNAITHPAITALAYMEIDLARSENARGAVIDAAALFESPLASACDITAAVTAPADIRLQRIMKRDGITREQALTRMSAQYGDEYYSEKADVIIHNGPDDNFVDDITLLIKGDKENG